MSTETAMQLLQHMLVEAAELSAPILIAALVTGLLIGLFQAVTQLNEPTLSFVPKAIAVIGVIAALGPWMLTTLITYTQHLILSMPSALN